MSQFSAALSRRRRSRSLGTGGFTILELLVVLLVIGILAVMLVDSFSALQARADRVHCSSNLKNLYVGLASYVQEQGHWPQCPFEIGDEGFDEWWIHELANYKLSQVNWQCPTYNRLQLTGEASKVERTIHYIPTPFDDAPRTPYKWATQPWAVEFGDFHGDGNLILFPDGSIRAFNEFAAGQH